VFQAKRNSSLTCSIKVSPPPFECMFSPSARIPSRAQQMRSSRIYLLIPRENPCGQHPASQTSALDVSSLDLLIALRENLFPPNIYLSPRACILSETRRLGSVNIYPHLNTDKQQLPPNETSTMSIPFTSSPRVINEPIIQIRQTHYQTKYRFKYKISRSMLFISLALSQFCFMAFELVRSFGFFHQDHLFFTELQPPVTVSNV